MVNILSFNEMFLYAQVHGYFWIFLIMIVEGPIMTVAGAFAASLGYLNIWVILILSFFGDVVGDGLAYYFGYFSRKKVIEKYGRFFGIKNKSFKLLENHFKNHLGKTLFIVKATPLAIPGLMIAGASKVPLKRYVFWNAINILPKTLFFIMLGYFFGLFAGPVLNYYHKTEYYILALVIIVLITYFGWRELSKTFFRNSDNIKLNRKKK